MTHDNDAARDLLARIDDALGGITPGEWCEQEASGIPEAYWDCTVAALVNGRDPSLVTDVARKVFNSNDRRFIAAAPSLLREARAEIAALRARVAARDTGADGA